jgi:hypothetical protein
MAVSGPGQSAPTLSGGKAPERVPIGDRAAVQVALKRDGVVIVTALPGDPSSPGY